MLTKPQANKLRELIEDYADGVADAAFAGAQTPEDAQALVSAESDAKDALSQYIKELEK